MERWAIAQGAIIEALRPKTSGQSVDAHVVRTQKEPTPDYEKMRRAVNGELGQTEIAAS